MSFKKTKGFHFFLDTDLKKKLEKEATQQGRSLANLINFILLEFIRNKESN